jgi:NAD(P)-dependent dehydrogenase (short-subunit alcohol dehydrogenase family)
MKNIKGKVALITGAGSGIGRATALALAEEGVALILCDIQEQSLAEVEQEIVKSGARCLLAKKVDVSVREEMRAFADEVHALIPAVDILVNNAGVGMVGGIEETKLDDWDWILGINVKGVVHGCHFFTPRMIERRSGHVVNISSGLGFLAAPRVLAYSTTKFAVFGLSESLRVELAPKGIGVSTICPGIISTNIVDANCRLDGISNGERIKTRVSDIFKKRGHSPKIVASAIVDAVINNRAVVPVSPEAWASYYLKRAFPWASGPLSRIFAKQVMGE